MDWKFERIAGPFDFAEGPVWMGDHLLFTDIPNSRIMKYDPSDRSCVEFRTGTNRANGLTLGRDGTLFACEGGASSLPGGEDSAALQGRRIVIYKPGEDAIALADQWEGIRSSGVHTEFGVNVFQVFGDCPRTDAKNTPNFGISFPTG